MPLEAFSGGATCLQLCATGSPATCRRLRKTQLFAPASKARASARSAPHRPNLMRQSKDSAFASVRLLASSISKPQAASEHAAERLLCPFGEHPTHDALHLR